MCKAKRVLSWLLVFAMIFSLIPQNMVRAEREEEEYNQEYVEAKDSEQIGADDANYIEEEESSVDEADSTEERGFNTYNVDDEEFDDEYDGDYDDEENYYVYVNSLISSMSGFGSYDSDWDKFQVSVPDGQEGVTGGEGNFYVKNEITLHITLPKGYGKDYLTVQNYGEEIKGLSFQKVETDTEEDVYSVTVPVTGEMSLSVWDSTYCRVNIDYVAEDFICYVLDGDNQLMSTSVKQGESCTFYIQKSGESGDIEDLNISVNGNEIDNGALVSEDAGNSVWSYTISNITEDQNIKIYENGNALTVSLNDILPGYEILDADGKPVNLDGNSAVDFTVPFGEDFTFQIKGASDALDYGIIYNNEELTPKPVEGKADVYSYTLSNVSWRISLQFTKKYRLTSPFAILLCDEAGNVLEGQSESGSKVMYIYANQPVYFKSVDLGAKYYRFSVADDSDVDLWLSDSETGVYYLRTSGSDVELTAEQLYAVLFEDVQYTSINILNGDYIDETYYVSGQLEFELNIWDANYDNMEVTVTGEDGEDIAIETTYEDKGWDSATFTYQSKEPIHQNVTINVTGVYSSESMYMSLDYNSESFSRIKTKLQDAKTGEEVELYENGWYVYEYIDYELVVYGDSKVLSEIGATGEDRRTGEMTELQFETGDGYIKAPVKGTCRRIYLHKEGELYVNYACESGLDRGRICLYETDENIKGYYKRGKLKFYIDSDEYGYTAKNAKVTKILDSKGNSVKFTSIENQEVGDYGTRATVYTVDVQDDITIYYTGMETQKYDFYLPLPSAADGYSVSGLRLSYYDEDAEEEVEKNLTGTEDSKNKRTKYTVEYDSIVKFDITVKDAAKGLIVHCTSLQDEEGNQYVVQEDNSEENEDGSKTYHYSIRWVDESMSISATINTRELTIEMKNGGSFEKCEDEYGDSYYAILKDNGEVLAKVYSLPMVIDNANTSKVYPFNIEVPELYDEENYRFYHAYRVARDRENDLFTAYDAQEKEYTNLCQGKDAYYLDFELPAGVTKLVIDTSCFVENVNYIRLTSDIDDITIEPVEMNGATFRKVEGENDEYIPDTDTLYVKVSAKDAQSLVGTCLDKGGIDISKVEKSEDGLSEIYILENIDHDAEIRVAYEAQYQIKNDVENVELYAEFWFGESDENGVVSGIASGQILPLVIHTDVGYDPDSVTIIQECDGEEVARYQPEEYIGPIGGGSAQWYRDCNVVLRPGMNIFYATEPKQITYSITWPNSPAYTIEPVNGSTTTVGYNKSFSFRIKGNKGYDISKIQVTANKNTLTPDEDGIYTIRRIKDDITIQVTGFNKVNTSDPVVTYVVTFKDYDGKVIGSPQTVEIGKAAKAPADPQRKGYRFKGWDKSFSNVQSDLVVNAVYEQILVSKLTITGDITKLAAGKSVQLKANAAPADALDQNVIWTSSNKQYATVDAKGKVKALKKGAGKTVTITATATDGSGVKGTYKIKIYKNAVKKIKLSAKTKSVKPGKKVTIKAKVTPTKSVNKTLKWSSSNKKYATVNSKGVVTTKKAGKGKTVTITAKATDGSNKKATIKIKIKKK